MSAVAVRAQTLGIGATEAAASITSVSYRYPSMDQDALHDVSLQLHAGLTIVAGPSGGGKSTVLRLLNGLIPHFHGGHISGTTTVRGVDTLRTTTAALAREVGFVFQDPETQLVRSVVEDEVAFALENTGVAPRSMGPRVEAAMAAAGVLGLVGRTVASLSGGERQRVAIASALALDPRVLVLDEPTAQLDPEGARTVIETCTRLAREGRVVLLSEHRVAALLDVADRLALVAEGTLTGPAHPRELLGALVDPPPLVLLARLLGWSRAPITVAEARPLAPRLPAPRPATVQRAGQPAWELRGAVLELNGRTILESVDLAGVAGEVSVLMGPNGGGKTTLLRAIAGLHRPRAGSAWRRDGRVAYLPQDPGVLLHRQSVLAEVEYTLQRSRSSQPAAGILRRLGLTAMAQRYPGDLSSGQRQRAALAAVLAGEPGLVILDEPTRGMDGAARASLVSVVREMAAAGASVVVATHDADLAADLADRVVVVDGAAARDCGSPLAALSGDRPYATDIGRLYPGGPVTVSGVMDLLA